MAKSDLRFEEQVHVEIKCCRQPMRLVGNLSLRGAAGVTSTRLAYECTACRRKVQVTDCWDKPDLAAIDSEEDA